ncbi:MAG: hypothetical protein HY335_02025 [Deinococcus sp.]|nr:hypothetical protein [Deinococcus sp.]
MGSLELFHTPEPPYVCRLATDQVSVRLKVTGTVERCGLEFQGRSVPMQLLGQLPGEEVYQAEVPYESQAPYRFQVWQHGQLHWLGKGGSGPEVESFVLPDLVPFLTPQWVKDAVFYQIFPDRFANGDPGNDPPQVEPWGGEPTKSNYFGGDLQGIVKRLDYLAELGVNALYLNPLFASSTNHRYHTRDYYQIDSHLGTSEDLRQLVKACHQRGMHLILDGVFNHTGTDFWAFRAAEQHGPSSRYWHWYTFRGYPVVQTPTPNYLAWWGLRELPQLNHANPEVREYLLQVAEYWIREFDIDGWRLDVPNEIPHRFWQEFRRRVKALKPDAYIVGEIWDQATPWLQGDQFDGVMNYQFRNAVRDFVTGKLDGAGLAHALTHVYLEYPPPAWAALYNLLDSHDTERFFTLVSGDGRLFQLGLALLLLYPGAPALYYGDEVGVTGGKDPENRRCFPWEPQQQDRALQSWVRRLVRLRHAHPVLRHGHPWCAGSGEVFTCRLSLNGQALLLVLNRGEHTHLALGLAKARELLSHARYVADAAGLMAIPPRSALLLAP